MKAKSVYIAMIGAFFAGGVILGALLPTGDILTIQPALAQPTSTPTPLPTHSAVKCNTTSVICFYDVFGVKRRFADVMALPSPTMSAAASPTPTATPT